MTASGLVGNILNYHSSVVLPAIRTELASNPGGASTHPLVPGEFADELSSVLAAFSSLLEYPPDFRWTVEPGEADVTVTRLAAEPPVCNIAQASGEAEAA